MRRTLLSLILFWAILAHASEPLPATVTADAVIVHWPDHQIEVWTFTSATAARRTRTSRTYPTHVEVTDTIENPTAAAIGLHVRHTVAADPLTTALGGRTDPGLTALYNPWNPSLFAVASPTTGVGLLAEDDVFRNQAQLLRDPAAHTASLRTDLLCLAPGGTYQMVWSIYPTASADYWDFINAVRRDWHANDVTIPGAMVWFHPDDILARPPGALRAALTQQNVAVASLSGGWVDPQRTDSPPRIGFGTHVMDAPFADYRGRLRAAVAALHAARPGMRVLLYFDSQRDSSPEAATRFGDSLLVDPRGRPERNDFGQRFTPSWSMVPTTTNEFGRALTTTATALRTLGADGLYWDEMDAVAYDAPRLTAAVWDEHTCRLDESGQIIANLGLANLLSDPVKATIARDTFVLGNSPPTTRQFQHRPDLRMVEAQHNNLWGAFAHLSTPIGYLGSWIDWPRVRAKIDEGVLVAGGSLDRPSAFIARLYPFTPEDLRPGVLRGRERIVATRSGFYGWPNDTSPVRTFRYDHDGVESPGAWVSERQASGVVVHVSLNEGEAAIIERAPSATTNQLRTTAGAKPDRSRPR